MDLNEQGDIYLSSPEIEKAVLGAVLIEKAILYEIGGDFTENLFFDKKHQIIARGILNLFIANDPIDLLTITNELRRMEQLKFIGGAYYVSTLTDRIASTANIQTHVKILQQFHLSRYINDICGQSRFRLYNGGHDIFDVYAELQQKLEDALKDVIRHEMNSVRDIHIESIQKSIQVIEQGGASGVPTHLNMVDNLTNGFQPSDLIIIAGRSGMGKTALAVQLLLNPAMFSNIPVAMFSLEMSKHQLVGRMQSTLSGIDVSRIIKKQITREELDIIDNSCKALYSAPLFIDDTPSISLTELKMKARKLVNEHKVKLIVVDYLQLMKSGLNISNREQEVAEISKGLKALAKELDLPIIALSQLSRAVESRPDKKPQLSDLRESGQIEQDADMVIFCYRPEYYGITDYELGSHHFDTKGLFMFMVSKHRNGALGEIPLTFIHEQTKVVNRGLENNTHIQRSYTPQVDDNTNVPVFKSDNNEVPF
tara:strand:- start:14006 stop:15451 length:1446 start_codon:yes stop_codon:yes gene_type:complete